MRKKGQDSGKPEKLTLVTALRGGRFADIGGGLAGTPEIPFEATGFGIADLAEREGRAVVMPSKVETSEKTARNQAQELKRALSGAASSCAARPFESRVSAKDRVAT